MLASVVVAYLAYVVLMVASTVWISRDARRLGARATGRGFAAANLFFFPVPALVWLWRRRSHRVPRYVGR